MTDTPKNPTPPMHPIAVSPNEAARLAGVGRTSLYAAIAKGELKSLKIGTRRLITINALRAWLHRHEQATGD